MTQWPAERGGMCRVQAAVNTPKADVCSVADGVKGMICNDLPRAQTAVNLPTLRSPTRHSCTCNLGRESFHSSVKRSAGWYDPSTPPPPPPRPGSPASHPVLISTTAANSQKKPLREPDLPPSLLRSADEDLPLLNKRVIVTAPRQYAGKLCGMLVEAGAQALSLPMIQVRRLSEPAAVEVRAAACCTCWCLAARSCPM